MRADHHLFNAPEAGSSPGRRAPRWRSLVIAGTVVSLLAILAGVVWGITRLQPGTAVAPHATPTVTATTAPHLVYQSDWSRGADGWKLPATATVSDGHLIVDGSQAVSITIPYTPMTRNYTLTMDFEILSVTLGGHFGLTARNAAGDRQYLAQMQCTPMHEGAWNPALGGCAGAILVAARGGTYPSGLWTSDYVIHGGPQTFQVEVTGDTVNFCPADDCLVPVNSATPLDASPRLIIEERGVRLLVRRVTITTL